MVVMEDVTEEERSAELYVSVHGGLDHTFLKRGGGGVIPFSDKISKVVFDVAKCFLRLSSNVNSSKENWQCNVLFLYQFDTYDYIHPVCVQSN